MSTNGSLTNSTSSTAELIAQDEAARTTVANDLGRTLFVEAGAGTGKTTALVGRIVNLVLKADSAIALNQIAAITFTEAAAAELRERVRLAFEQALVAAVEAGDSERAERCAVALADADVAAIQTLHGFAQRLLSEFPVEVGIPPRVEVIDEVRSQLAFEARWSGFLDALYEDPNLEEFIVRASILGVSLGGKELRNIAHIFDDNWDRLRGVEASTVRPIPINFHGIHDAIRQIEELETLCSDESDKLLIKVRDLSQIFARFKAATSEHDRLRVTRSLAALKFGKVGTKSNWSIPVEDARATCAALVDACDVLLGQVADQTLTQLAARVAEFTITSAEVRRDEGVLEFHDLLVLAHHLLRTSSVARTSLAERYRVLMLDEFQDTDPIQISLALLLASSVDGDTFEGEWSDLTPGAGRLFMVGDPKQSIYRFRRADITLFLAARDAFGDGSVALQQNFRTVEPIIDAVNGLFAEVMPDDTEAQAKYSPLIADRLPSADVDHRPLVFGRGMEASAGDIRDAEAAEVASIIADIRAHPSNWPIDDGNGGWKEPQLSDITILLPTRTSMAQLSAALDDLDIAFRADTGTLVYETQEVKDLLNVLHAIDDPSNEIALVAALRSPLYACGYDDLHAFRNGGGRFSIDVSFPDSVEGTVVADAIAHIRALAARKWWDEPSELLLRLIDERYAMALPAHGRRARDTWRRLRYVVDQARAFAESGGGDLRAYLEWTRLQGVDGSRAHEPMLPEPDDIAVQIMTIHGSKGLEFPITIVSGTTTEARSRPTVGEVVWGEPGELPEVRAKSSVRTERFDQAKELDAEMDQPERDRLLYVALTRARDHLAVSGFHKVTAKGVIRPSHGATVAKWAADSGSELVRSWDVPDMAPEVHLTTSDRAAVPMVDTPEVWAARHRARIAGGSGRSAISATALARSVAAGHAPRAGAMATSALADESSDDDVRNGDDSPEDGGLPPRVFTRGRAGSAIGSAVHGVLQLLDLTAVDDADITSLSESQAWAESVPEHAVTIERAVRSALSAEIVRTCRTVPHHKELYVAAPVGSMTIEGYVDLLVETPDGLVVVDYKTDAVTTEADIEAKLAHYALQGTAYALAIERATGQTVSDVQFIFARPDGPIVRSVPDLDAQREAILTAVAAPTA